jgi:hypothetical protein
MVAAKSFHLMQPAHTAFCADKGYAIAGVEFGRECYCDSQMRNGASNTTLLPDVNCGLVSVAPAVTKPLLGKLMLYGHPDLHWPGHGEVRRVLHPLTHDQPQSLPGGTRRSRWMVLHGLPQREQGGRKGAQVARVQLRRHDGGDVCDRV